MEIYTNYTQAKVKASKEQKNIILIFDSYSSPNGFIDALLSNNKIKSSLEEYIVVKLFNEDQQNAKFQVDVFGSRIQPIIYKLDFETEKVIDVLEYSKPSKVFDFLK